MWYTPAPVDSSPDYERILEEDSLEERSNDLLEDNKILEDDIKKYRNKIEELEKELSKIKSKGGKLMSVNYERTNKKDISEFFKECKRNNEYEEPKATINYELEYKRILNENQEILEEIDNLENKVSKLEQEKEDLEILYFDTIKFFIGR